MTDDFHTDNEIQTLLAQRAETHGPYKHNSYLAQEINNLYRRCPGYYALSYEERQSLTESATKVARLLTNENASFEARKENWRDIIGYGVLAHDAVLELELSSGHSVAETEPEPEEDERHDANQEQELRAEEAL